MLAITLILTLFGGPTAEEPAAGDCPKGAYLADADMGCACGPDTLEALRGCGDAQCTDEGLEYLDIGCDTGECKGVDCG